MTRSILASITLLLALAGMGCETTGAETPDSGPAQNDANTIDDTGPPPDTNADAGPPNAVSYMPEGCTYMVSTPHVVAAGMSRDEFSDTPDATGSLYTSAPGHIHTSWAGATDTTFAVNWHTNLATFGSSILVGTDMATVMAADDATTGVTRHDGHWMVVPAGGPGPNSQVHEVHVCGLTASTTYYYRVGGPGHWSDVFDFATGPTVGSTEPFTFGLTGDSRGYEDNAWAITEQHMQERAVDFELFSGDAVEIGTSEAQWNQFFEQTITGTFDVQDFMAHRPMMMANGNHDLLAAAYLAQFALPQEMTMGELGQGEDWYSFDYGNAHFVVLNDTLSMAVAAGSEATWLTADLDAVDRTATPWVFVMHHQPLYTCAMSHDPLYALRNVWQPILDSHHVDFVLAGHNHEYERTVPIFQFTGTDGHPAAMGTDAVPVITGGTPSGTIYMVAAGAGAPLYPIDPSVCPTTYTGQSVRNYATFAIDGRSIHVTVRNALTEAVIDEFMYTK